MLGKLFQLSLTNPVQFVYGWLVGNHGGHAVETSNFAAADFVQLSIAHGKHGLHVGFGVEKGFVKVRLEELSAVLVDDFDIAGIAEGVAVGTSADDRPCKA